MQKIILLMLLVVLFMSCSNETNLNNKPFRLISYNVWYGFTKAPERKAEWQQWMREQHPDIVSLQELNEYTQETLQADAQSWGHDYSVLLKEKGFPTGITSRYPIRDVQRYFDGFHHGLLRVKIGGIYVYVIHLHPSNWEARIQEMEHILADIHSLPENAPIILAGDFNTFSSYDAPYYAHGNLQPFFAHRDSVYNEKNLRDGNLDYSVLDMLVSAGFVDVEYQQRTDLYKFTGSFPSNLAANSNNGSARRLDYVFTTPPLAQRVARAEIVADSLTQTLSDHLPMLVDFK